MPEEKSRLGLVVIFILVVIIAGMLIAFSINTPKLIARGTELAKADYAQKEKAEADRKETRRYHEIRGEFWATKATLQKYLGRLDADITAFKKEREEFKREKCGEERRRGIVVLNEKIKFYEKERRRTKTAITKTGKFIKTLP